VVGKLRLKSARTTKSAGSRVIELRMDSTLNVSQLADSSDKRLSESESYVLDVLAQQQRVVISGRTTSGVFYGLQSLLSLINAYNHTLPVYVSHSHSSQFHLRLIDRLGKYRQNVAILTIV